MVGRATSNENDSPASHDRGNKWPDASERDSGLQAGPVSFTDLQSVGVSESRSPINGVLAGPVRAMEALHFAGSTLWITLFVGKHRDSKRHNRDDK
jgi:hypothetical protein